VDLGDDLLEATASLRKKISPNETGTSVSSLSSTHTLGRRTDEGLYRSDEIDDISDAMRSVQILISEDMIDDAKKVLHAILRKDPRYLPARQKLSEVREAELKRWLSGGGIPFVRKLPGAVQAPQMPTVQEAQSILDGLDRELGLGLSNAAVSEPDPVTGLSLFESREAVENYSRSIEAELDSLSPREKMDVGIGFYEMGLYPVSSRLFRAALRVGEAQGLPEIRLGASHLLAQTLLSHHEPFEAMIVIDPVINDEEVAPSDKIHFLYLLGLAYEQSGSKESARLCFRKIHEADPAYRDVLERIKG
jgi:tetratricopeptide (TPR) repeat protein